MVGIDGIVYIGNHGLERWANGHPELTKEAKDYPETIKAVIQELTPLLSIDGVTIEDKGATTTVHYRLCPEPETARRAILTALQKLPQARKLRIIQERKAIDLLPNLEANKGTALRDLIHRYNLRRALYLGDDLTDIDAFRAIHTVSRDFQGLAIGITSQEMPENFIAEADFTLDGVSDVERFLKWLSQTVAAPG
jgi:trehalose 6-phosphate phosphatase